jgi:CHAD domain-containing protein
MYRANHSTHPVQTLRDTAIALEAAVLLCLAKPGKKAVHQLRTSTRRVEAQLELLSRVPRLPAREGHTRKLRRLLKDMRRAAGRVRDIDVQRELIKKEAGSSGDGTNRARRDRADRTLREETRTLRRELKRRREEEAEHLLRLLRRRRERLPLALQGLLDSLEPAERIALSESQLTALARGCYKGSLRRQPDAKGSQAAQLHGMRKRAKLARYIAESSPEEAVAAHRLAALFERVQQAGGEWHDWLLLEQVAAEELGDSAKLPQRFAAHAETALHVFQRRLGYKI